MQSQSITIPLTNSIVKTKLGVQGFRQMLYCYYINNDLTSSSYSNII